MKFDAEQLKGQIELKTITDAQAWNNVTNLINEYVDEHPDNKELNFLHDLWILWFEGAQLLGGYSHSGHGRDRFIALLRKVEETIKTKE